MYDFEKFNGTLFHNNNFYSSLSGKGINDKQYQHVLKGIKFKWKLWKTITILLAEVFDKFRNKFQDNSDLCVTAII